MSSFSVSVFILAFVSLNAHAAKFPTGFQLCRRHDPKIDTCLVPAIGKAFKLMADGIPSLHVLPIDPQAVTQILVQDSPGRPVNFNINLTDATLKGLRNTQVRTVESDLDKQIVDIDLYVPLIEVTGDYVMNGKFLVLPLKGTGKGNFKLHDTQIKVQYRGSFLKKNGDTYWNIVSFHTDIYKMSRLETKLTGLFNGDDSLAKPTLDALNSNWETFWAELRPSIEESFSYIFKNIVNDILKKVPEKNMFLPENE